MLLLPLSEEPLLLTEELLLPLTEEPLLLIEEPLLRCDILFELLSRSDVADFNLPSLLWRLTDFNSLLLLLSFTVSFFGLDFSTSFLGLDVTAFLELDLGLDFVDFVVSFFVAVFFFSGGVYLYEGEAGSAGLLRHG